MDDKKLYQSISVTSAAAIAVLGTQRHAGHFYGQRYKVLAAPPKKLLKDRTEIKRKRKQARANRRRR